MPDRNSSKATQEYKRAIENLKEEIEKLEEDINRLKEVEELRQKLKDNKREIEELKKRKPRSRNSETDREDTELTTAQKEAIERATKAHNEIALQAERHYTGGSRYEHAHPRCVRTNLPEGHPTFTTLDLEWTRSGEWIAVPRRRETQNKEDEEVYNYKVARLEPFVDREGKEHKALCYGTDSTTLMVWYSWEEIKDFFSLWTPPKTPIWVNLKAWSDSARYERPPPTPPKKIDNSRPPPPPSPTQRGNPRGGYRNSGRGRGGNISYNREENQPRWQEDRYQDNYSNYERGNGPDRNTRRDNEYRQNYHSQQRKEEEDRGYGRQDRRQE